MKFEENRAQLRDPAQRQQIKENYIAATRQGAESDDDPTVSWFAAMRMGAHVVQPLVWVIHLPRAPQFRAPRRIRIRSRLHSRMTATRR
jgi:hypothetical protein